MSCAVKFEGVSKRYRGGGPRYGSLRHDLTEGVHRIRRLLSRNGAEPQGKLALDDVSFEVGRGESFAIIGPNGAGKTTALKLISRISYPTGGRVRVRGRVGALIEVGSGVHPELTARENIWLYGQILGMTRGDITRRFQEIVDFAELDDSLDVPVKMYSTGMQLRLGFAIAAHLDPDIFLVDEALAVGDAGFQAKCVEHMTRLVAEGKTILFVSHNLSAVESVCQRALFILNGGIAALGQTKPVIRSYLDWVDEVHQGRFKSVLATRKASAIALDGLTCHDRKSNERYVFHTGDDIEIRLHFRSAKAMESVHINVGVAEGRNLVLCSTLADGTPPPRLDEESVVVCRLHGIPLLPRLYQVWCSVRSGQGYGDLFDWQQVGAFRIEHRGRSGAIPNAIHTSIDGPIFVRHDWEIRTDGS